MAPLADQAVGAFAPSCGEDFPKWLRGEHTITACVGGEGEPLLRSSRNLWDNLPLVTTSRGRPFELDGALVRGWPRRSAVDGDTGEGLGASHQTGWTALVAHLLSPRLPPDPRWA